MGLIDWNELEFLIIIEFSSTWAASSRNLRTRPGPICRPESKNSSAVLVSELAKEKVAKKTVLFLFPPSFDISRPSVLDAWKVVALMHKWPENVDIGASLGCHLYFWVQQQNVSSSFYVKLCNIRAHQVAKCLSLSILSYTCISVYWPPLL